MLPATDSIRTFLDYLSHEAAASPLTIETYQSDLRSFTAYAEERLGEPFVPSEGDLDLVRGWLSVKLDEGLKASTVGRCLTSVRSFYRHLLKTGQIKRNPIQALRPPKAARPLPVYVPTEDMEQMLSEEVDPTDWRAVRDHLILTMLYECGLRRSEIAGLRDQAVDTTERQLKVLGKGRKERIVPFGKGLAEEIEAWRHLRTSIFGTTESFFVSSKGTPMAPRAVYQVAARSQHSCRCIATVTLFSTSFSSPFSPSAPLPKYGKRTSPPRARPRRSTGAMTESSTILLGEPCIFPYPRSLHEVVPHSLRTSFCPSNPSGADR